MEPPEEFIARLADALDVAATGDFSARLEPGGSDAGRRTGLAFNRLMEALGKSATESNIAIAGLAVANVRLTLWNEALHKINAADSVLYHGGDIDVFFKRVVTDAMEMTRARYGALAVFDEKGALAEFVTRGMDEDTIRAIGRKPEGKGLLGAVFNEQAPVRVDDIGADPRSCGFPPGHPPMKSLMGVPMRIGGKLKGVIYLAEKEKGELFGVHGERLADTFTEDDETMLGLFADYLARALERIELMQMLTESNRLLESRWSEQQELIRKLNDAQSQLLQSEKMASIGQLAAGVAHELNNPIGFVSSNIGTLGNYLQDIFDITAAYEAAENGSCAPCPQLDAVRALKREKDFDYLKADIVQLMAESKDGLGRVAKIVRDLKDFSRAGDAGAQWADLHQGLDSTLNIVWNELKYKCTVKKEYDGELPPVWCVPSQLNQVFMNLLVNAAHAIPEKGEIAIRTGQEGGEVFVAISDTGMGIPAENLHRIFEPFFTTKPVGKGTGLGLSLAYSIVQKHQGRIEVQSEVGRGTTFTLWLPIAPPAAPATIEAGEAGET